ncbi:tetratricopeptide repeat protein [Magnetovibrio sp. PR-2]|uniref:tetratricopeptide repeat protein n=1 Tax=Magnetovibrio sp. PR-2 TaxID=3120356 RepID=UPI002FCE28A6
MVQLKTILKTMAVGLVLFTAPLAGSAAWAGDVPVTKADVERAANAGEFDKAYELLVQLAESGNAQAQGFLAYVLAEGEWGVPVDEVQAKSWMEKALSQNDAFAHLMLALTNDPDSVDFYTDDPSIIKIDDWKRSMRIAAENGHPYAQNELGEWARLKRETNVALEWYRKATGENRDFYAANYYSSKSWALQPSEYRIHDLMRVRGGGNPRGYLALSIAFAWGMGTEKNYRLAQQYRYMAAFLGEAVDDRTIRIIEYHLTQEEQKAQFRVAYDLFSTWFRNPATYAGQAAAVCINNNDFNSVCLKHTLDDHRECAVAYTLWSFNQVIEFPAYLQCRLTRLKKHYS